MKIKGQKLYLVGKINESFHEDDKSLRLIGPYRTIDKAREALDNEWDFVLETTVTKVFKAGQRVLEEIEKEEIERNEDL